jgi:type II secretory pathway pseudopilin PulG
MRRRGSTLVELLVALVILQVGLLGVVGTLVLSARTVAAVTLLERGINEVEWTLDSLASSSRAGAGERLVEPGEVAWWSDATETVWVEFRVGDASVARMWTSLLALEP